MKITILVDNYVPNDKYLAGEPSFSCFIQHDDLRILFDTGISAMPMKNAAKLKIDLSDLDYVVLSHGHLDHTWGLRHYVAHFVNSARVASGTRGRTGDSRRASGSRTKLLCHPLALEPKKYGRENIGIKGTEAELAPHFEIITTKAPFHLDDKTVFLGEIPRTTGFENKAPLGKAKIGGTWIDDYLPDDSALAIDTDEGIVIVTGCSHSGICNIVEQAKKVLNKTRIRTIVGGFHLQSADPNDDTLIHTRQFLSRQDIGTIYPCHCTNLLCKTEIARAVSVGEAGSGTCLEF